MSHPRSTRSQVAIGLEIAGREEILRVLLKAGVVVVLGTLALLALFEGGRIVLWPYAALLGSHCAAWVLLRSRRLRLAVLTHATVYIATILLVLFLYGGLRSPASFVLSPIVLLVGLTWNGRAAIVTAGASSLGLLGLVGLRAIHDRHERGELTYWVVATAVLALTSVVLAIALRAIGRAQAHAFDAERERWSLQEQLLRSQRLETVAKLAAGVAHDFNNFLNVIIGQAGLLARHPDEKASAQAQQIESAAWRAADLTQKLLAVGQNRALETRELDLNEIVRGIEPLLRRSVTGPDGSARSDGAERLHFDLEPLPLPVRADAAGLEQILMNLVRNASDATRNGGEIRVVTRRAGATEVARLTEFAAQAGGAIRLEVADSGVGMDAEVQAHLFEPFFTTKPPGEGTGLGLASVYGIVQQCGGTIQVESAAGRGASFRVYLESAGLAPKSFPPTRPDGAA